MIAIFVQIAHLFIKFLRRQGQRAAIFRINFVIVENRNIDQVGRVILTTGDGPGTDSGRSQKRNQQHRRNQSKHKAFVAHAGSPFCTTLCRIYCPSSWHYDFSLDLSATAVNDFRPGNFQQAVRSHRQRRVGYSGCGRDRVECRKLFGVNLLSPQVTMSNANPCRHRPTSRPEHTDIALCSSILLRNCYSRKRGISYQISLKKYPDKF